MSLLLRGCLQKLGVAKCAPLLVPSSNPNLPIFPQPNRNYAGRSISNVQDEATLIRQRIPKSMSAHTLFVKENFHEVKNEMDNKTTSEVFCAVMRNFKSISPAEMAQYQQKAKAAQKMHQKVMSALTADEKEVLLVDFRKRALEKRISAIGKEIRSLKRELDYPPLATSSFGLFWKASAKLVDPTLTVSEKGKALGSMWNSLDAEKRQRYSQQAAKEMEGARERLKAWRQSQTRIALTRFDELRSQGRRLKLKLHKLMTSPSVDEAIRMGRRVVKPKKLRQRKTKSKVGRKRKILASKVGKKRLTTKKAGLKKKPAKKVIKKTKK